MVSETFHRGIRLRPWHQGHEEDHQGPQSRIARADGVDHLRKLMGADGEKGPIGRSTGLPRAGWFRMVYLLGNILLYKVDDDLGVRPFIESHKTMKPRRYIFFLALEIW